MIRRNAEAWYTKPDMRTDADIAALEQIVLGARSGLSDDLRAILRRGVSLYEGDTEGNAYELTPDGHRFLVAIRNHRLDRIREVTAS